MTPHVHFPNPYDNHLSFSLVDIAIKLQWLTYKENWEMFPSSPLEGKFLFMYFKHGLLLRQLL